MFKSFLVTRSTKIAYSNFSISDIWTSVEQLNWMRHSPTSQQIDACGYTSGVWRNVRRSLRLTNKLSVQHIGNRTTILSYEQFGSLFHLTYFSICIQSPIWPHQRTKSRRSPAARFGTHATASSRPPSELVRGRPHQYLPQSQHGPLPLWIPKYSVKNYVDDPKAFSLNSNIAYAEIILQWPICGKTRGRCKAIKC